MSRLIYVRYCLTNITLCFLRSYDGTLACNYVIFLIFFINNSTSILFIENITYTNLN